jgi:AraC-like DNA-binding protein
MAVRTSAELASGPAFTATAVTCVDDHTGWSHSELVTDHRIVLVRRGRFGRQCDGARAIHDSTLAYLSVPGTEERFAHPAGGDVCTALTIGADLWTTFGPDRLKSAVLVDARLDLAHRRFVRASRHQDVHFAVTEQLLELLHQAIGTPSTEQASSGRDRGIVDAAREAIAADDPAAHGLLALSGAIGVSPYRLSRSFTRQLGSSLTNYRNRVRIGRALDRLEHGEASLSTLAVDLGFADQAHLTRTMRAHLGYTPSAVRRMLTVE